MVCFNRGRVGLAWMFRSSLPEKPNNYKSGLSLDRHISLSKPLLHMTRRGVHPPPHKMACASLQAEISAFETAEWNRLLKPGEGAAERGGVPLCPRRGDHPFRGFYTGRIEALVLRL